MDKSVLRKLFLPLIIVFSIGLLQGCATSQSKDDNYESPDQLEPVNRSFYQINEALDKALLKPIAEVYAEYTPQPVRTGLTNFFDNINYLNVILNSLLQGKISQGLSDIMRFLFNSIVGIGGLIDVATDMGFPENNEDLGQTLATWGFSQGSYLYLPVSGPNTVRNLPDMASSYFLNPFTYVSSVILWPISAMNLINTRANLLDDTKIRDEAAIDPYSFTREAYIQRRNYLVHDGNPPTEIYDDIFDEELEDDSVLIIE